jgi:hypothetical protein
MNRNRKNRNQNYMPSHELRYRRKPKRYELEDQYLDEQTADYGDFRGATNDRTSTNGMRNSRSYLSSRSHDNRSVHYGYAEDDNFYEFGNRGSRRTPFGRDDRYEQSYYGNNSNYKYMGNESRTHNSNRNGGGGLKRRSHQQRIDNGSPISSSRQTYERPLRNRRPW